MHTGGGRETGPAAGERGRPLRLLHRPAAHHHVPHAPGPGTHADGRNASPARNPMAGVVAVVVPWVSTERGSVSLIERFRTSYRFCRRNLRRFSRTRSKMMIVSLSEYPTMVNTAPTTTRLTSRFR